MAKSFEWPWQYTFPPFFTVQPNEETREKQLKTWCDLLLAYARHTSMAVLDVDEATAAPPFRNDSIKRALPRDGIVLVLDTLAKTGNVEWLPGKDKQQCLVMWRSPEQWAEIIFKWVVDTGYTNTVCTLFELREGSEGEGTAFHGMEKRLFRKALTVLQRQGKAELIIVEDEEDDMSDSVKFFS